MNRHRYSIILVYILAIVMCLSTTNIAFATESVTEPAKADSVTEEANAGEEELTKDENTGSAEKEKSNAKNEETVNSAESTDTAEVSIAAASEEKVSAAASYTDSNLNNFVNSFTLENLTSGKQIPLSPKPSVNTQDEYLFTMKFVEVADGKQFANVCTYTLPAGLDLTMNLNQDIRLKDGTKVATATGTAHQSTITVTFLNNWPSDSLESQMEFAFHAMFNSTASDNNFTVDLGNNVKCVVDLSVGASLDVQKTAEKVGATDQVFDAANHTIKYSVTVTANGAVNNAKFTDTYSNNMTLQKATVKVNGVTATATDFTPSDTTKRGFEIDLGNMRSGDQKVVTYTMKADDSVLFANGGYTVHNFDNEAKVEGTAGGKTISDKSSKTVTHSQNNFNKWTSDVTGNDKQISWTIAIGDNTYNDGLDLRGKTVQDTLGPDHQLVTTLPSGWNGPIKVTYSTRAANGTVTNNNVAYYNSLNNITFPNTADPIVYATINYKTECDSATFPAVGSKDYRNTAEININSGWKVVKDTTKQGAGIPGISKRIVDAGQPGGKMSFEIVVDVPAGTDTLQYFYLGDVFNIMNGFADNTQITDITAYENLVIKVGGQTLVEGTDYTVAANKNIYFGSTQKATSKWPYSTAQKMVITYDVTRTNAATAPSASGYTYTTIDGALDAGLSLRNTATVVYRSNGSAEATKTSTVYYAEKTTPSMEKKAVNIDTAKHTIDYEVTIDPKLFPNSGSNTNFTFKDTFDGRLEYVAGTLQVERHYKDKNFADKTSRYWGKVTAPATGNTLSFEAVNQKLDGGTYPPLNMDYKFNDTLVVKYTLHIKDSEYSKLDKNKINELFDNEALITADGTTAVVSDKETAYYPMGNMSKEAVLKSGETDVVKYIIDLNPKAIQLNNGNTIQLQDNFITTNMSLQTATLKVEKEDKNNPGTWINVGTCWKFAQGGQQITFDLDDATHYQVTYEVKVTEYGKSVKVINEAQLAGQSTSSILSKEEFAISKSSGSASSNHGQFTLWKSDVADGTALAGATFELYTKKQNDTVLSKTITEGGQTYYCASLPGSNDQTPATFTTNSQGYVLIDHTVLTLLQSDTYYLVETNAPNGYDKLTNPIPITFNPSATTPIVGQRVMDQGSMSVENSKSAGILGQIGLDVHKTLKGRDFQPTDAFTFTVTPKNGAPAFDFSSVTMTGLTGSAPGMATFGNAIFNKAGTYEYTVKETKGNIKGIIYDETEYTVVIKATDVGNNNLVITKTVMVGNNVKTGMTDPEFTNTYDENKAKGDKEKNKDDGADTGDYSNMSLWLMLMGLASVCGGTVIFTRRKREDR